ncbi:hypothetical protein [Pragia fontium]|uniref:Carbohydrate binding domain-containing protein n=1 Tax=Pragia fontium DSM 5563 = ATCC 49100 TaxID=1122977 RepID=A0AAJ4WAP1_9GAMM|nr:hypothetical protein [Pragia fontium]SFC86487.1 Carbohydrate binding domain-containing protein [Pragia fontium DSM 5563 = ATCC 49100]
MTIYQRPDEKILAESSKQGEVKDFPDISRGWGVAFDKTGGIPPMEWFNALGKRTDEAVRYLLQRGIAEWSKTEDYPVGALVSHNQGIWLAEQSSKGVEPKTNSLWKETALTIEQIRKLIPVNSVNGKMGNVVLNAGDVGALKRGDFGLGTRSPLLPAGTNFSSDLVTSSNNEFTLSGKYIGTPDDNKVWGATLTVKRRLYDANCACTLILFHEGTHYIKHGNKSTGSWIWSNWESIILSSGGTFSGEVIIDKDIAPTLTFKKKNRVYRNAFSGDDTFIHYITGQDGDKTRLRWISDKNTWNFESCNVTKNGKNLLVDGEYGLGSKNLVVDSKFTDDITKQNGTFQASPPNELPESMKGSGMLGCAGLTIPYRTSSLPYSYRILFSADPYGVASKTPAVFFQEYALNGWGKPVEAITTANINDHMLSNIEYDYLTGTSENPIIISMNSHYIFKDKYAGKGVTYVPQCRVIGSDGKTRWLKLVFLSHFNNGAQKWYSYGVNIIRDIEHAELNIVTGQTLLAKNRDASGIPVNYYPSTSIAEFPFRLAIYK